ncbi:hypothetical protein TIFTF001_033126 [Ficus carica]|uniref:Uncharacterized protein n=1 Tax=Ficus carica TaxID=3494 RepID=A0AA88DYE0_FICCA|nr:hypothetical protein TIFTF001_033126 [Ficus carica]
MAVGQGGRRQRQWWLDRILRERWWRLGEGCGYLEKSRVGEEK